jgi:lipopolysaccharide/colanic/teichoic acid biosynthesis glycosyltransferase
MNGPGHAGYLTVKRLFDVVVSGLGLVAGAPVMAAVAVAIRQDLGSPVLFRQERPGRHGKPFELIKFRTMHKQIGTDSDVDRMTKLGRWLRSTSLDELPTLWNVFRGDMSLIGPRPLLIQYLARYTAEQSRRHEVKPGVTGLAQIRGRNALTWAEKFAADVEYIDRLSFRLDVRILLATVTAVLRRRGISASESETMPEFLGTVPRPLTTSADESAKGRLS